jgi:hypothetical protein
MAQKKEAKKIKVRDLKPKKDAKGGIKRGWYGPGRGIDDLKSVKGS